MRPKPPPFAPVESSDLRDPVDPLVDERDRQVAKLHREFDKRRAALTATHIPNFSRMTVASIGAWFKRYAIRGDAAYRKDQLEELARAEMLAVWELHGRDKHGNVTLAERARIRKLVPEEKEDEEDT